MPNTPPKDAAPRCPKFGVCLIKIRVGEPDHETATWGWDGDVENPTITPSIGCDAAPVPALIAERDAALAQVAVLNETIYREMVNIRIIWNKSQKRRAAHEGPCFETSVETILQALSNTSTTAQLRVEAIGREATDELMQALRDYGRHASAIPELGIEGCSYDPEEGTACTCGLAAILGEKKP